VADQKKIGNYPIRIRQNESLKKQRNNQKHKEGHVQINKSVNYIQCVIRPLGEIEGGAHAFLVREEKEKRKLRDHFTVMTNHLSMKYELN
jgi:hypothetical protein